MNEFKETIAAHFAANPKSDNLFVTREGSCFPDWHHANEHSKTLGSSTADREITEVKRADYVKAGDGKLTLAEQIEACTTVEEVAALIKNNTPKAMKELAAAKIEALKAA